MHRILLTVCLVSAYFSTARAQNGKQGSTASMTPEMTEWWEPVPPVATPGKVDPDVIIPPPSNATVLFDGKDLSEWEAAPDSQVIVPGKDMSKFKSSSSGKKAAWTVKDGALIVNKQAGDIQTKRTFGDFQLHIEWSVPEAIQGSGQFRGNSGVFLQGRYELQILDSYNNKTYVNGQAGSIYKQTAPLANVMRKPGEWNVYDILYTAPTFKKDGSYRIKPMVTVLHNGVLIQYNTIILGTTPYIGLPKVIPHGNGPIRLQAHNDKSEPIRFRNIWIIEL